MSLLFQLVVAFFSTLGFALLFHLRPKLLVPACLGGVLTWAIYVISKQYIDGVFWPCLIASFMAAGYASLLANRTKEPLAVFYILAEVPLIPGSGLFNTMSSIASLNWDAAASFGLTTASFVLAIALSLAAFAVLTGLKDAALSKLSDTDKD